MCSCGTVCLLSEGKKILVSSVTSVAEMLVNDSLKETYSWSEISIFWKLMGWSMTDGLLVLNKEEGKHSNKQANTQTDRKQQTNRTGKQTSKQTLNNTTISLRTSVTGTKAARSRNFSCPSCDTGSRIFSCPSCEFVAPRWR